MRECLKAQAKGKVQDRHITEEDTQGKQCDRMNYQKKHEQLQYILGHGKKVNHCESVQHVKRKNMNMKKTMRRRRKCYKSQMTKLNR